MSHGLLPGDLDPSFDRNGKRVVAYPGNALAVLVQANGKIVLAGSYLTAKDSGTVTRLRPNGATDRGFGDKGIVSIPFPHDRGFPLVWDATLQDDGRIVVVGGAEGRFAVARVLPDGSLDPSFSSDGMQLTNFGVHLTGKHSGDTALAVTMDGDDIVVAGTVGFGAWGLVRYLPDGTRDPSFGQDGRSSRTRRTSSPSRWPSTPRRTSS